ncbi:Histidine protein methyltransferase 1 [Actinomortierella wolfii]|nr:Histidine protein methyltransferase 1 [Actinomortierella wolfii]
MFKFNFTADDLDLDDTSSVEQQQDDLDISRPLSELSVADDQLVPAGLLDLNSPEFLRGLPASIHYELAKILLKNKASSTASETSKADTSVQDFVTLYKRNLEDVKFQMALEDDDLGGGNTAESSKDQQEKEKDTKKSMTGPGGLEMLALADKSDLVKGVYEGGLKTWECALDLVAYLAENPESYDGKRVLELGCGSALPGIYVLTKSESVQVDFQDYNDQVLRLVTLPNILLNTCTRPDLQPEPEDDEDSEEEGDTKKEKTEGEEGEDKEGEQEDDDDDDDGELDDPEKNANDFQGTELDLPAAEDEKRALLERVQAQSKLIRGDWSGFVNLMGIQDNDEATKYDLILTSETIYAEENHQKLYQTIKRSLKKNGKAYVAAKSFYFGVGGDILSFQRLIEKDGAFNVRSVFSAQTFVRREILELTFKQ